MSLTRSLIYAAAAVLLSPLSSAQTFQRLGTCPTLGESRIDLCFELDFILTTANRMYLPT
jgi:hypothetical protein